MNDEDIELKFCEFKQNKMKYVKEEELNFLAELFKISDNTLKCIMNYIDKNIQNKHSEQIKNMLEEYYEHLEEYYKYNEKINFKAGIKIASKEN